MWSRAVRAATLSVASALTLLAACASPPGEIPTEPSYARAGAQGGGGPVVDSTVPDQALQDTTLDVTVLGENFDQGSTVAFLLDRKASAKIRTNQVTFVSAGELVANVTVDPDAEVALYDVQVTALGGKKGIGIERFEVLARTNPGQWDHPVLDLTLREGPSGTDALRSDAAQLTYAGAGRIALNGNLMFWLSSQSSPRSVLVTTSALAGSTQDRIFTNSHTNPGGDDGFGLLGMTNGSVGSAVFEVELDAGGTHPYEVVRYGKDCAGKGPGSGNVVPSTKVVTTRSADGSTWTITGVTGVHCKQVGKKPGLSQVGTAGAFGMTLMLVSP